MKISIVIPVYNEERGIGATLERTLAACKGMLALDGVEAVEVIVVNDGSTDATSTTISMFPEVIQVIHPTNRGYGAALLTGFQMACGDALGFLDTDGTYPPDQGTRGASEKPRPLFFHWSVQSQQLAAGEAARGQDALTIRSARIVRENPDSLCRSYLPAIMIATKSARL